MTIRIEIEGVLGEQWGEWFESMALSYEGANTILSGTCKDQAAFHGILNLIRDLNLTLISLHTDIKNNIQY